MATGILRGQLAAVRTAWHPHPAFPAPDSKGGLAHVCDPVALAGYQDTREAAR